MSGNAFLIKSGLIAPNPESDFFERPRREEPNRHGSADRIPAAIEVPEYGDRHCADGEDLPAPFEDLGPFVSDREKPPDLLQVSAMARIVQKEVAELGAVEDVNILGLNSLQVTACKGNGVPEEDTGPEDKQNHATQRHGGSNQQEDEAKQFFNHGQRESSRRWDEWPADRDAFSLNRLCRHAGDGGARRNIPGDNAAGAHRGTISDCYAFEHVHVGPQPAVSPDLGCPADQCPLDISTIVIVIRDIAERSDHTAFPDGH